MRFTYTRSRELRSGRLTLAGILLAETPLWAGLAWFLHGPWRYLPLTIVGMGIVALGLIFAPYYRPHRLTKGVLTLRVGLASIYIPTALIRAVTRFAGHVDVPFAGQLTTYVSEEDALVLASASRGLLDIQLASSFTVRVPRQGLCSFTRVLLYVDEPERLQTALGGPASTDAAIPAPSPAPAPLPTPALPSAEPSPEGLVAHGLTKRYGSFTAVQGLDLTIHPGEVVALLGANGAGKSTTLQMLAGLSRPDAGAIQIAGWDIWSHPVEARARFGYVPDTPLFHESLTAREFLWFVGDLYRLDPEIVRTRTEELLQRMRLTPRADTWVLGYSLGMRRKLSIAAGLLHRPPVLILDEITNGLDPRANREVLDLLAELAAGGTAVLLATHVLAVAAEQAQRIAILHEGRLRAVGTLPELRLAAGLPADASLEAVFLALTAGGERVCA